MDFLERINQASDSLLRARQNAIEDQEGKAGTFIFTNQPFKSNIDQLAKPIVICFEGIDGSGKDTQIALLKKYLEFKGDKVYEIKSLANTEISPVVRKRSDEGKTDPLAMLCLYLAELALVNEQIHKLKKEGEYDYILLNRWTYSTYAYGYRGDTNGYLTAGIKALSYAYSMPDILVMLNVAAKDTIQRLKDRGEEVDEKRFIHKYNMVNTRYAGFILYTRGWARTNILEVREGKPIPNKELESITGWENHVYILHKLFELKPEELTKLIPQYAMREFPQNKENKE